MCVEEQADRRLDAAFSLLHSPVQRSTIGHEYVHLILARLPDAARNLCRPEVVSVRETARQLGELLGRPPHFTGTEASTALLANPRRICAELGAPAVGLESLVRWTADWVKKDGRSLGKPTHFEVRDGRY